MQLHYQVVFGKDGILRLYNESENQAIAATDAQKIEQLSSSHFLMRILKNRVILEAGSTIGTLLQCLEPWCADVSALTDRDVGSYLAELRKPAVADNAYTRIEMRTRVVIHRPIISIPWDGDMEIDEYLALPREFEPEKFEVDVIRDISGYKDGEPENWSVSSSGIHRIKNVPLVLNRQSIFMESGSRRSPFKDLLSKDTEGVKVIDDTRIAYVKMIDGDDIQWTVYDVIDVVICDGLWYHTPAGAEHAAAELAEIIENNADLFDHGDADGEGDEEHDDGDDEAHGTEESASTGMKVTIADGAFSSLRRSLDREQSEWDEAIKDANQVPVRIGKFAETLPSDDRICGRFL